MTRKILFVFALLLFSSVTVFAASGKNPVVEMNTSQGVIRVELFESQAPASVKNFLNYTKKKFYDGVIFHRVIPGFMIQGGGFTTDMVQKATGAPIRNEAGNRLKNRRGTLAMARTSDPDSATAQFFINVVDNSMLDRPQPDGYGYAVFGKVIQGMDVVDRIKVVRTGHVNGMGDVPLEPVVIRSVRVVR